MVLPGNYDLASLRARDPAAWRARVRAALQASHGVVSRAAVALQTHRVTLHRWLQDDPELRAALRAARRRGNSSSGDLR